MAAKEIRQDVNAETEVKTTALAGILGISARRVQQLAQDDILRPARRGWFALGDSVQRYLTFLEKERKQLQEDDLKQEKARRKAETDMKKAKAAIALMEVNELSGKMHRSEDVRAMTEQLIYAVRSVLTAMPGRLAEDVAAAETAVEASVIIRREVGAALREIAQFQYDPEAYEALVRDRRNWDEKHPEETG